MLSARLYKVEPKARIRPRRTSMTSESHTKRNGSRKYREERIRKEGSSSHSRLPRKGWKSDKHRINQRNRWHMAPGWAPVSPWGLEAAVSASYREVDTTRQENIVNLGSVNDRFRTALLYGICCLIDKSLVYGNQIAKIITKLATNVS